MRVDIVLFPSVQSVTWHFPAVKFSVQRFAFSRLTQAATPLLPRARPRAPAELRRTGSRTRSSTGSCTRPNRSRCAANEHGVESRLLSVPMSYGVYFYIDCSKIPVRRPERDTTKLSASRQRIYSVCPCLRLVIFSANVYHRCVHTFKIVTITAINSI